MKKIKALFQIFLVISLSIFSSLQISAIDNPQTTTNTQTTTTSNPYGCCQTTNHGDTCVYTTQNNCNENFLEETQCEDSPACNTGCCVIDGQCANTVSTQTCQSQGGTYFGTSCSEVSTCTQGCCQIGENYFLSTAIQCTTLSEQNNIERENVAFLSDVTDEVSCTQQRLNQDQGCCIEQNGICTSTTREQCGEQNFQENTCSSIPLCGCEKHASKQCFEEDVYWIDSCGNKEEKAQDCDYSSGTLCSQEPEGAQCISIDCETTLDKKTLWGDDVRDGDGVARKNGESWCEYDGAVGLGRDLVGSRHYRHLCLNGKEIVEPCRDYREELCIEGQIAFDDGTELNQARCIPNNWDECTTTCNSAKGITNYNQREAALADDQYCCEDNEKTCFWQSADQQAIQELSGTPELCGEDEEGNPIPCTTSHATSNEGVCLPLIPPGGVFWNTDDEDTQQPSSDLQEVCEPATQSCTIYFHKDITTGYSWSIAGNGQCLLPEKFILPAQASCNTYADCGVKYNVAGELGTGAYDCSSDDGDCMGSIHGHDYQLEGLDWNSLFGGRSAYSKAAPLNVGRINTNNAVLQNIQYADYAAIGVLVAAGALGYVFAGSIPAGIAFATSLGGLIGTSAAAAATTAVPVAATVGTVAGAASVSEVAIGVVGTAVATAAPAAGAGSLLTSIGAGLAALCPSIIGCVIAAVVIAVLTVISIVSDTDKFTITNTCNAWEAPRGGDNCELCRDQEVYETLGYDTCSEYRCKSLGTACSYLQENEGSIRSPCVETNINDVSAPIITADPTVLSEGYRISQSTRGYEILPQVPAYYPLTFGILTNEAARCRISETVGEDYENMTVDFGDSYFSQTHQTTALPVPSTQNEFYIRCEDVNGNQNEADYLIKFTGGDEPDLTPPLILETSINNGASASVGTTPFSISLNEPASCKYDTNETNYESMKKNFQCSQNIDTRSPLARYSCDTSLTVMQGENNYNIACKDNSGNINIEPLVFALIGSPPLTIDSIQPNGTIDTNKVTIEVLTSGGNANGFSKCSYSVSGKIGQFENTESNVHTTPLPQLSRGTHTLTITCKDELNTASLNTILNLLNDDTPPEFKNFYTEGSLLTITTDEIATCEYSLTTFNYGEGTKFETTNDERHSTTLTQTTYHIICQDGEGNTGEEVIIIP